MPIALTGFSQSYEEQLFNKPARKTAGEKSSRQVRLGRRSDQAAGKVSSRHARQGREELELAGWGWAGAANELLGRVRSSGQTRQWGRLRISGEAVRQGRWNALQVAASDCSCILRSITCPSHIRPGHCCTMRRPPLPSHPPPLRPPRLPLPSLPSRRCLGTSPAVHPSRAWASLGAASFELSSAWLIYT